jgi:hypothetical protein
VKTPRTLPIACFSSLYVRLDRHDVYMFRFLLEAYDNLAIMSVVDRWSAALKIAYSPHQHAELLEALESMRETVNFTLLFDRAESTL